MVSSSVAAGDYQRGEGGINTGNWGQKGPDHRNFSIGLLCKVKILVFVRALNKLDL